MVVRINIRMLTGDQFTIDVPDEKFQGTTVLQLKEEFEFLNGVPADQQIIIFKGYCLEDSKLLCDYGVTDGSIIYLRLRLRGGDPKAVGGGGMGDKHGKNRSNERLSNF